MADPELTQQQKNRLSEILTEDLKSEMISRTNPDLIQAIGEEVLTDALRLKPKMVDVKNAPSSFFNGCNRLIRTAPNSKSAFHVIGGAVIIAREYTKQLTAFRKEQ